jgi:tetratricopeptide (TPR) repeat protein
MKSLLKIMTVAGAIAVMSLSSMTSATARTDIVPTLAADQKLAAVENVTKETPPTFRHMSGEAIGAFLAGRQARKDGDTSAAATYFARVFSHDLENNWLARRSFLLDVSDGRIARALPLAGRVLEQNDRAPIARVVVSADHMKNERYGKTEAVINKAGKRGAMQLVGPLMRAWAAFGSGDTKGALGRLRPLEKKVSFTPFVAYHKALLLGASGDIAGALDALDSLPKNMSLDLRSRLVYASLLEKRDGAEAAEAYLKGLTARYGEDPVLRAYLHHGRPISTAFPVKTAQDGMAEAFYGAANALSRDSVDDVTRIYLHLALYLRPDLDVAHALLGDMLDEKDHWAEAITAYEAIESSSPYKWAANVRIAWAMDSLGRTDEAEKLLRSMADERPDNVSTLATLADVMRGHSRFGDAASVYQEAVDRIGTPGSRHWSIYYALGIALERSKQWEAAEASLLKALELSPNQPLVMNYLGYSWADKGMKLDEAVEMVQKAVDQRPADGYVIDSLGWAHFRRGSFDDALKHLERATELRPEDPIINEHLGDVYWKVGRKLESCFQWRHALSLDPDAHQIPILKAKMTDGLDENDQGFSGCKF